LTHTLTVKAEKWDNQTKTSHEVTLVVRVDDDGKLTVLDVKEPSRDS